MTDFIFRTACLDDIPFLTETIIQAEKSGTEILSYKEIFGLQELEIRNIIKDILLEEIDGCELSVSSFLIAESNGVIAGAIASWIEGHFGSSSSFLKANLLSYYLPKSSIEKASGINHIINELNIDHLKDSFQLGLVYISNVFRGMNLVSKMINHQISEFKLIRPEINEMYVQVFGNNIPAIKTYQKSNFEIIFKKEVTNKEILNYLPCNEKLLMKKNII